MRPLQITIAQFAEEIIKLTGTTQQVIYKPLPKDDPMQRQPDITLARKLLMPDGLREGAQGEPRRRAEDHLRLLQGPER
jgi:dTDP-glucose 4,6-dehydratase